MQCSAVVFVRLLSVKWSNALYITVNYILNSWVQRFAVVRCANFLLQMRQHLTCSAAAMANTSRKRKSQLNAKLPARHASHKTGFHVLGFCHGVHERRKFARLQLLIKYPVSQVSFIVFTDENCLSWHVRQTARMTACQLHNVFNIQLIDLRRPAPIVHIW